MGTSGRDGGCSYATAPAKCGSSKTVGERDARCGTARTSSPMTRCRTRSTQIRCHPHAISGHEAQECDERDDTGTQMPVVRHGQAADWIAASTQGSARWSTRPMGSAYELGQG